MGGLSTGVLETGQGVSEDWEGLEGWGTGVEELVLSDGQESAD